MADSDADACGFLISLSFYYFGDSFYDILVFLLE